MLEQKDPVERDEKQSLISVLERTPHDFNTLKARRVELEFYMNGQGDKVRSNIAIYRDSLIAVSIVPALGYEVLRILCTKDSVIVINRPDKSYSASSFNYYRKKYKIPVDYYDLQAILSNEVFYYKEELSERVLEKKINYRNKKKLFIVDAFRDGKRITNQGIELDVNGIKLENIFITDYDTRMKMNIKYDDFIWEEKVLFPRKMNIDLIEGNNTIKLYMRYGQVVFNDSINLEFEVPSKYTRRDI